MVDDLDGTRLMGDLKSSMFFADEPRHRFAKRTAGCPNRKPGDFRIWLTPPTVIVAWPRIMAKDGKSMTISSQHPSATVEAYLENT
jgi:hypothetical protein